MEDSASTTPRPPRLSVRAFLHEVAEELFSVDRGLLWSLAQLLWRPGWLIRHYVERRDPRITRPLRLTLFCLAGAALMFQIMGAGSFVDGLSDGFDAAHGGKADAFIVGAFESFFSHIELITVLCWAPAAGAALQRGYPDLALNFAEGFVFGLFSLCLTLLLLPPLYWLVSNSAGTWPLLLLAAPVWGFAYPAYGYGRIQGHAFPRAVACSLLMIVYLWLWAAAVFLLWTLGLYWAALARG